jgi:hypothetical protein
MYIIAKNYRVKDISLGFEVGVTGLPKTMSPRTNVLGYLRLDSRLGMANLFLRLSSSFAYNSAKRVGKRKKKMVFAHIV